MAKTPTSGGGFEAVKAAAPKAVKEFLQRGEKQMQAFVERYLATEGAVGDSRAGEKIGAVSGALSRALIPNQLGHIGRIGNPTAEHLVSRPFGIKYGIDTKVIKYALIHELGGSITVTDKMRGFFWAKFYETGFDKYKAMALSKKSAFVIPPRPYFEPGVEAFQKEGAPKLLKQLEARLVRAFNRGGA